MDYILNRLNRKIDIEENNLNKLTLSRERLEYCLIFLLDYLWNMNFDMMLLDDKMDMILRLQNLQIGDIVSMVGKLNINKQVLGNKAFKEIEKYPNIRNNALGHGYTHMDDAEDVVFVLQDIYNKISDEIQLFSENWTIIYVKSIKDGIAKGEKYAIDGLPDLWECNQCIYEFAQDRVYAFNENLQYIKLSPFIEIRSDGEEKYIFRKLKEKLTGQVVFNQLISTGISEKNFIELAELCAEELSEKRISANLTIMNNFKCNYKEYIVNGVDQGIKQVKDFIIKNSANVNATIWGHGGAGKTACIQKVCMDIFHGKMKKLDYIIFLSAKDRVYNTYTGQIDSLNDEHPIRTYEDIMFSIGNMICSSGNKEITVKDIENEFINFSGKILVIIDDLETFERGEIQKIKDLIPKLDAHVHKIIFTTRSNQIIGQEIAFNEMDIAEMTNFLISDIATRHPTYTERFKEVCKDEKIVKSIHEATDGRPLFLFQFVEIFIQSGLDGNKWKELKSSENAKEFLYGRIYGYLAEKSQILFCAIYKIVDTESLLFSKEMLKFIVSKYVGENEFDSTFTELIKLKILELYEAENYRIYSKEIVAIMGEEFRKQSSNFQSYVSGQQRKVGGKQGVIKSIYQARLDEANNLRQYGNKLEVEERYRSLLRDNKTPIEIKRKSLCNLCSYYQITVLDNSMAIKTYEDFISLFRNDATICRLYAQTLWTEGEKAKAIQNIEMYFSDNKIETKSNPEMAYLLLAYRANFLLEKFCSLEAPITDQGMTRKYSEKKNAIIDSMIKFIAEKQITHIVDTSNPQWKNFTPKIKHNAEMLISQVLKIYVILSTIHIKYVHEGIKVLAFANQHLGQQYTTFLSKTKKELYSIENEINGHSLNQFSVEEGNIGFGMVVGVKNYGAFIQLNAEQTGLLHISKIGNEYIPCIFDELKVGEILCVRIDKIDTNTGKISLETVK